MKDRYVVKTVNLPGRMTQDKQEYYYAYDTVEKKQACTPTLFKPDAQRFADTLNNKKPIVQFSELTREEIDQLEAQRKARAIEKGTDLLDDVRCVHD